MKFTVTSISATPGQSQANVSFMESEATGTPRTVNISLPLEEVSNYSLGSIYNIDFQAEGSSSV